MAQRGISHCDYNGHTFFELTSSTNQYGTLSDMLTRIRWSDIVYSELNLFCARSLFLSLSFSLFRSLSLSLFPPLLSLSLVTTVSLGAQSACYVIMNKFFPSSYTYSLVATARLFFHDFHKPFCLNEWIFKWTLQIFVCRIHAMPCIQFCWLFCWRYSFFRSKTTVFFIQN